MGNGWWRIDGLFCNRTGNRGYSAQTVSCESAQKKSVVCLKRAVQVAVEDVISQQVGCHAEADLVLPQRTLNRDPRDLDPAQSFLLYRRIACRGNRGEQWGSNSLVFQPIGNLPGLLGRFQEVRLEGVDGSQDSQGFAGPEDSRIWE